MFQLGHYATVPVLHDAKTFYFLYLTEGKGKQKLGNIPFTKNKTKKTQSKARRGG